MDSPPSPDRDSTTTPFLLKLFYRTGTFHRPDEFATTAPSSLPTHLPIHAYPTTTLLELAHHIASLRPAALPSPAIGTRLSFRLIYPDAAAPPAPSRLLPPDQSSAPPPRYLAKDLGSLVLGYEDGRAVKVGNGDDDEDMLNDDDENNGNAQPPEVSPAGNKTLADAKFVVGDYLSVAVLPPDGSTGAVAPAVVVETSSNRPTGTRGFSTGVAPPPGPVRGGGRERGALGGGRFGREREREWDGRGGRDHRDRGHGSFPEGEWRRGERLPDAGPRGGSRRAPSRW